MEQGVPSGIDLIWLLRVMQSVVNLHKTGRIIGCNIVPFQKLCHHSDAFET
ncbi:unnamed protein product [Brassica oleracea var. botrytis]